VLLWSKLVATCRAFHTVVKSRLGSIELCTLTPDKGYVIALTKDYHPIEVHGGGVYEEYRLLPQIVYTPHVVDIECGQLHLSFTVNLAIPFAPFFGIRLHAWLSSRVTRFKGGERRPPWPE
jgi:hypothetical protein